MMKRVMPLFGIVLPPHSPNGVLVNRITPCLYDDNIRTMCDFLQTPSISLSVGLWAPAKILYHWTCKEHARRFRELNMMVSRSDGGAQWRTSRDSWMNPTRQQPWPLLIHLHLSIDGVTWVLFPNIIALPSFYSILKVQCNVLNAAEPLTFGSRRANPTVHG